MSFQKKIQKRRKSVGSARLVVRVDQRKLTEFDCEGGVIRNLAENHGKGDTIDRGKKEIIVCGADYNRDRPEIERH